MKKQFIKMSGIALAGAMILSSVPVMASEEVPAQEPAAIEAAETTGPAVTLEALNASYVELFPEVEKEEYKNIWISRLEENGLDSETAELARELLISMMKSEVYGEEAAKLAAEDPTYSMFDCYFINGPVQITVDGDEIYGIDKDGKEIFRHTYVYDETVKADFGAQNEMYAEVLSEEDWPALDIYTSPDADDDFKYFAFAGDTPAKTYHIEFRYGKDKEGLASYFDGNYAYWLAAGIPADYSEELITNCINLFVDENAPSIAAMFTAEDSVQDAAAAE